MFKRISALILITVLLFSLAGCGNKQKHIFYTSQAVTGYMPFGNIGGLSLKNTEGMEFVCENEYLALFYDAETYVVTVFDKRTGRSYSSSHKSEQVGGNNSNLAALNLIYSDTQGKTGSIDSYTQSVALDQVEVEKTDKGITFTYSIGDVSEGLEVTPSIISNERFEALLEKADSEQQKVLERRYSYIKDSDSWARRNLANPTAIQQLVDVFLDLGYTSEDLSRDNKENGVADARDDKLAFTVPLTFALDGDSVTASIDLEKVTYPQNNPLVKIEFLQYFAAAAAGEKGYFLLPDGSGAIMEFDTVESGTKSFMAAVYGNDSAMRQMASASKTAVALMPIYGGCYYDGGFLAVIEDGEALADIYAYNSGASDSYSKVYSTVNFLKTESVALGENQASDNFNYYNFQDESYNGNYTVRYIFLEKEKCDYNGMASAYRNYLTSTDQLKKAEQSENAPFILETVGGIISNKSFLGFQYKGITALTEYSDNITMVNQLLESGIENISLRLTAFSGDGLMNTVPDKIKLIGVLGGKSGMKNMLKEADNIGLLVYPDFEYLTFSANSGVLTKNKYSAKSMDSKAVELEVLNQATLQKNIQIEDNLYYLTAINKLQSVNDSVKKYLDKYNFKTVSIADMASGSASDFTESAAYDRQSSVNYTGDLLKGLSSEYSLMLNSPNIKNARYASIISEAPLWSSQYEFCEGVPFYSMVFHGYIDYTGEAINLSADPKTEFLRCVEYGAGLQYLLVYRNKQAIKNSDYTYLYSTGFEENAEKAVEDYKALNSVYTKTAGETIEKHQKLAQSVYYTEYSNGVRTVVNYSDEDYTTEYGTVSAGSYIISDKEGI